MYTKDATTVTDTSGSCTCDPAIGTAVEPTVVTGTVVQPTVVEGTVVPTEGTQYNYLQNLLRAGEIRTPHAHHLRRLPLQNLLKAGEIRTPHAHHLRRLPLQNLLAITPTVGTNLSSLGETVTPTTGTTIG